MEEAGNDPNGENAASGPSAATSSGFGGLGFDGMVGMEEVIGEILPPEEGNRGAMSGDISWIGGEDRGLDKNAGEVVIVEEASNSNSKLRWEEKDSKGDDIKAIVSATSNQKEAIDNDDEIIKAKFLKSVMVYDRNSIEWAFDGRQEWEP